MTSVRWLAVFVLAALSSSVALWGQTATAGSHVGLLLRDLTPERAQEVRLNSPRGAEVVAVENGSPAAEAGIQPRDVLLTYNGEPILGREQLGRLVFQTPPGRHVGIRLWRNGSTLTVSVVTTAAPQQLTDLLPDYPIAPDIPGTVIVWRNRILGTVCETMPEQMSGFFGVARGVLVRFVDKGALGDISGLKPGDIIQASSDRPILSPRDLTGALMAEGGTVHAARFIVWRDHKRVIVEVHPAD